MARRWLIVFGLVLFPLIVRAQTPDWGTWQAMLYNPNQGDVYTINSTGDGEQFTLPAPANAVETIPRHVAVSRDGTRLAYMTYNTLIGNDPTVVQRPISGALVVYNRETETADEYPFVDINHHSLDYPPSPAVFSPDGNELAVGYNQPSGWFIAVLDVEARQYTGTVLEGAALDLIGASATYEQPIPVVTSYDGAQVEFMMVPGEAVDMPLTFNSFVWDRATGDVTPTTRFSTLDYSLFPPTGEVLEIRMDERTDAQNTVAVAQADGTTTSVFNDPNADLLRVKAIQGGAAAMVSGFSTEFDGLYWAVKPRSGALSFVTLPDPASSLGITDVGITGYGALVTADPNLVGERFGIQQFGGTSLVHIDSRDAFSPVLEPVTSFQAFGLQFIWNSYDAGSMPSELLPWDAATAAPVPAEALSIGGEATVNTTEGDPLNVRSAPGVGFSIVARVPNGEQVTLLEGPTSADNLMWWRVRTADGVEGWTVEAADNVNTLLPTGEPAPPPTATSLPDGLFVGGTATVVVGPGGAANMRAEPSTATQVVRVLRDGASLDVVGGPREAEGYTWWQVQTPDGAVLGWMVEAVEDEIVLSAP